jgi:hypothetical protein
MLARTPIMLLWVAVSQRLTVAHKSFDGFGAAADTGKAAAAQQATAAAVASNRLIGDAR